MRTFDPALLNEIANRDDVRPFLGGSGELDLRLTVENPANFAFVNQYGGFVTIALMPGLYEVHTIFTPERDGVNEILKLAAESQAFMFLHSDCMELITRVPEQNRPARILAVKGGFRPFAQQKDWEPGHDADVLRITLEDWILHAGPPRVEGWGFHAMLEERKKAQGSANKAHAEDERHDRYVGAALLMAKAGNILKGYMAYNRAAFIYGYQPVLLKSQTPPVVDMGDAIIGIEHGEVEVLLCR